MNEEIKKLFQEIYPMLEVPEYSGQEGGLITLDPRGDEFVKKIEEIKINVSKISTCLDNLLAHKVNNKFVRESIKNVNYINKYLIDLLIFRNEYDEKKIHIHDTIDNIIHVVDHKMYWDIC